jgi:hypothetical protein
MTLSDAERRWLDELERQLTRDDPRLAMFLAAGRSSRRTALTWVLLITGTTTAVAALLLTGVWPPAVWVLSAGTAAALTGVALLLADHHPPRPPANRRPP